MTIQFLRDHTVGLGDDEESFTKGQIVEDRSHDSEMHFVRRGHAAFLRDGKLYDHEDRLVVEAPEAAKAPAGSRRARERRAAPRAVVKSTTKAAPKRKAKPAKGSK